MPTIQAKFKLPPELHHSLKIRAAERNTNMSALVTDYITKGLIEDNNEPIQRPEMLTKKEAIAP